MAIYDNILDTIGNTPLVKLSTLGDIENAATVYAKCEYLQPSGSLKDRMARYIIEEAERQGQIKPGGTLVEATAGNTGLAISMVAAVKGYRSIFVIPDKFSIEKINMLKGFGSEVVITPTAVPDDHPESWTSVAKRIVGRTPNSMLVNQFFNEHNIDAHYATTGPELWEQTKGEVDVLVAGAGSGGTITGAGRYLKEQAAKVGKELKVVLIDPVGSAYFDCYYKNEKQDKVGWRMEGIGNDFIPGCLDLSVVDQVRKVTDRQAFSMARKIARKEGMFVGETSGAGVHVALEIAREIGPGKTVVAFLCDSGNRYVSKLYNDEWMREHGFATSVLGMGHGSVGDILEFKGGEVAFAQADETVGDVARRLGTLGVSQMPISGDGTRQHMMIHESDLLQRLLRREHSVNDLALTAAKPLQGVVRPDDDMVCLEPLFAKDNVAVVADTEDNIIGIVSQIDVVKYLASDMR